MQNSTKLSSYRSARKLFLSWYFNSSQTSHHPIRVHKTIEHAVDYDRTVEHVVPQCIYRKQRPELSGDMHNFMVYPGKLNRKRSNLRLTDHIPLTVSETSSTLFFPNEKDNNAKQPTISRKRNANCIEISVMDFEGNDKSLKKSSDLCGSAAFSYRGHFVPMVAHRGRLSRSVAYFIMTYPEFSQDIFEKVMTPEIMVMWHHMHPVSEWELQLDSHIEKTQGNHNVFVTHPEKIKVIDKYTKMDIFKHFDYANHFSTETKLE